MLRLLHRVLAGAEDVAAALLKESSAVVNLVPQTRHAPSGLEVRFWEIVQSAANSADHVGRVPGLDARAGLASIPSADNGLDWFE